MDVMGHTPPNETIYPDLPETTHQQAPPLFKTAPSVALRVPLEVW